MEMGKSRGNGERKEDVYMGIWEKARKDSRGMMGEGPSYGRNRGSSRHCPTEVTLQSTGMGHLRPTATSSLFSYKEEVKEEKMGGSRYCSRRHKVPGIRRETGKEEGSIAAAHGELSHLIATPVQSVLVLQRRDAWKPKGGKNKEN